MFKINNENTSKRYKNLEAVFLQNNYLKKYGKIVKKTFRKFKAVERTPLKDFLVSFKNFFLMAISQRLSSQILLRFI